MKRRAFLGATAATVGAGCLTTDSTPEDRSTERTATPTETPGGTQTPQEAETAIRPRTEPPTRTATGADTRTAVKRTGRPRRTSAPQSVPLGEALRIGASFTMRVHTLASGEALQTTDGRRVTPPDGRFFLFTTVEAAQYGDTTVPAYPVASDFRLVDHQYRLSPVTTLIDRTDPVELSTPVSGPLFVGGGRKPIPERAAGWVVFEVPHDISAEVGVVLALSEASDDVVEWTGEIGSSKSAHS